MSFILLSSIIGIEFLITPTVDEESSNGLQSSAHLDIDYGTNITCLNPTQVISSGNLFISFESEGEISELSCEGDGLLIDCNAASNVITLVNYQWLQFVFPCKFQGKDSKQPLFDLGNRKENSNFDS